MYFSVNYEKSLSEVWIFPKSHHLIFGVGEHLRVLPYGNGENFP
jgi:hypothetical protein